MVTVDINSFAQNNWCKYKKSVTSISKSTHSSLVENDMELYCFDDISNDLYIDNKKPTSADACIINKTNIELVEFKSGFRNKITKANFNPDLLKCEHSGEVCKDYLKIFIEKRKKEINELILSIRIKAIESYITLEKLVFPSCCSSEICMRLKFMVVIDEDYVDGIEDTIAEVAEVTGINNNPYSEIKDSLRRLTNNRDISGNSYLYDEVCVLSVMDFQNYLQLIKNES